MANINGGLKLGHFEHFELNIVLGFQIGQIKLSYRHLKH